MSMTGLDAFDTTVHKTNRSTTKGGTREYGGD